MRYAGWSRNFQAVVFVRFSFWIQIPTDCGTAQRPASLTVTPRRLTAAGSARARGPAVELRLSKSRSLSPTWPAVRCRANFANWPWRTICARAGPRRYSRQRETCWALSRSIPANRAAPCRSIIGSRGKSRIWRLWRSSASGRGKLFAHPNWWRAVKWMRSLAPSTHWRWNPRPTGWLSMCCAPSPMN